MIKVAVLVLADTETHGDLGRVVNAMVATKEFKEAEDDVQLIFDGAGTQWPAVLGEPNHRLHRLFEAVRDRVTGACGFCARAFDAEKGLEHEHVDLLEHYDDHPSIRELASILHALAGCGLGSFVYL